MTKNQKIIVGVLVAATVITVGIVVGKRVYSIIKGGGVRKAKPDRSDVEKLIESVSRIHPDIVARWNSYDENRKQRAIELVTRDWFTFNRFKEGIMQKELSYQFKQEFDF